MDLMVEAGFNKVFIGIETPDEECLAECSKVQNRNRDLVEDVKRIQRAGLQVQGGFIVGFDHDRPSIFQRQIDFIQKSGIVTAMVGLLQAPPGTRLYERMKKEGRLRGEVIGRQRGRDDQHHPGDEPGDAAGRLQAHPGAHLLPGALLPAHPDIPPRVQAAEDAGAAPVLAHPGARALLLPARHSWAGSGSTTGSSCSGLSSDAPGSSPRPSSWPSTATTSARSASCKRRNRLGCSGLQTVRAGRILVAPVVAGEPLREGWWSGRGSNPRPPECDSGALPTELPPRLANTTRTIYVLRTARASAFSLFSRPCALISHFAKCENPLQPVLGQPSPLLNSAPRTRQISPAPGSS